MINYKRILVFLFIAPTIAATAQNFEWAKSSGGNCQFGARGLATDGQGNVYVTGSFSSPYTVFGKDTLYAREFKLSSSMTLPYGAKGGDTTFSGLPTRNIFVVKYSPDGNIVWARCAQGKYSEGGNIGGVGIIADKIGNVYVTGSYSRSAPAFGTYKLPTTEQGSNVFIAKFDSIGNIVWAKNTVGIFNSNGGDCGSSLALDSKGGIYVAGAFCGTGIIFDSDTLYHQRMGYFNDVFIAKYNSVGNVEWVKGARSATHDWTCTVASDNKDDIYLSGTSMFSSTTFDNTVIRSCDKSDNWSRGNVFIVKFNTIGKVLWGICSTDTAYGRSENTGITTDKEGNVYITGNFMGPTMTIGNVVLKNTSISYTNHKAPGGSYFIIKLDKDAKVVWAKSSNADFGGSCNCIATDNKDNVYISGSFSGSELKFDDIVLHNSTITKGNIFLAKLDATGNAKWAVNLPESNNDQGRSVALDSKGNIYFAGFFSDRRITFGTTTLINRSDYFEMFLAKVRDK